MAGDVLLVTGGGRGIGASVVRRAAQAGIAVAFSYRSDEAAARAFVSEVESAGSRALAIRQDVGEADAIPGLFDAVENQLGPVPMTVNNAGITGRVGSFADTSADTPRPATQVNLPGTIFRAQGIGQLRGREKGGRTGERSW